MPNMITVSNIADRKASSPRAAISTMGYAYAVATDEGRYDSIPSSLVNQTISDDKPGGEVSMH